MHFVWPRVRGLQSYLKRAGETTKYCLKSKLSWLTLFNQLWLLLSWRKLELHWLFVNKMKTLYNRQNSEDRMLFCLTMWNFTSLKTIKTLILGLKCLVNFHTYSKLNVPLCCLAWDKYFVIMQHTHQLWCTLLFWWIFVLLAFLKADI